MARRCLRMATVVVAVGCSLSLFAGKSADPALSTALQNAAKLASATAGTKPKISIKKGDYELTLDGSLKIENYFENHAYMLNRNMPDECNYFKETADLNFDFAFGEEKYGYEAVEAYLGVRHKGIWGKALSYADRDSGTSASASVKLDETMFGSHNHYTSKSVLWIRDAWLKFALNPVFGAKGSNYIQYLQLGWFPFQLGRGIALGSIYGLNKEFLALYSYSGEDKSAPGVDLFGEVVKDTLWYDLYYSKLEERAKSLSDVISPVKGDYKGRKTTPWRGVNKDNDLVAARLKWTAVNNDKFGKLEVEPYIMCNFASDQYIEIDPDTNTRLGAYGLGLEHAYQDFEIGGEVAFNFGAEHVKAIDRNASQIKRDDDGYLYERYSNVVDVATNTNARVNANSKRASSVDFNSGSGNVNGQDIPGYANQYKNDEKRFRPAYKNNFRGWMSVLDAAYNLRKWNLKLAASWGYASGDVDPHKVEKNKNYNGFVGLHEGYCGKRVQSIFLLDQHLLRRPLALPYNKSKPETPEDGVDLSFTNIQMYGIGLTWSPTYSQNRTVSINPNVIGFWTTKSSHKINYIVDATSGKSVAITSPDMARDFMGTELNLVIKSEILKDLTLFGKFAAFCPGGYFRDIKGIPLDGDFYNKMSEVLPEDFNPSLYRLGSDTAYHVNIGLEFKF